MTLGITHTFGPWSPVRFIPVPFHEGPPSFWVTTSRICRGLHDYHCTQTETQTFGPLVLGGATPEDIWTCPTCQRQQPPVNTRVTGEAPTCLHCSDSAVQHTGDQQDTRAALSAIAALYTATATLQSVASVDQAGAIAMLEGIGDSLRLLLEHYAWAIKQDPIRSRYTVNQLAVRIARQIGANAKEYAQLSTEPFPVHERDTN